MTYNNIFSSSSSSSSSSPAPFRPLTGTQLLSLLPPHSRRPWTLDARLALYKNTPPRYLTNPFDLSDALIKKRPGRRPSPEDIANPSGTSAPLQKKRGAAGDAAPPTVGATSKKQRIGPNSSVGSSPTIESNTEVFDRQVAPKSHLNNQEYIESLCKQISVGKQTVAEQAWKIEEANKVTLRLKKDHVLLCQSVERLNMKKIAKEAEYFRLKKEKEDLVMFLKNKARPL